MDILSKELNLIYHSQRLQDEILSAREVERCKMLAEGASFCSKGCTVITDASCDRCYLFLNEMGILLGIAEEDRKMKEIGSSDEDDIYNLIHPEDLVEKRMLEYEFFKFVDRMSGEEKTSYQATCRLRIRNLKGRYIIIDNSTQVLCPSPAGKIWLILCCYTLAADQLWHGEIAPAIKNNRTGEVITLSFTERRQHVLTGREKEILLLIKEGKLSKEIADLLDISIHTVNRHRQNILEKLSVGNSIEAITAAEAMKLL